MIYTGVSLHIEPYCMLTLFGIEWLQYYFENHMKAYNFANFLKGFDNMWSYFTVLKYKFSQN